MIEYLMAGTGIAMLLVSILELYNMINNDDPELDNYFNEV